MSSTEAAALFLRAQQLRATCKSQHTREIIDLCKRAISLDPNYAQAWALLGLAQTLLGMDAGPGEDGAEAAEKALAIDPNVAEAHAVKARALIGQGKLDEARASVEKALELNPESYDVNAVAARYYIAAKKYGDAIKALTKAENLNPNDCWAVGMALQCHEARGDNVGARMAAQHGMERINKILAADPTNLDALERGVTTLLRIGQTAKAKDWVEKVLKQNPDSRSMRYNMACAMVQLGAFDRALDLLEPIATTCGRQSIEWFKVDTDLDPLRKSARFQHLIEDAEKRLAGGA